MRRTAHISQLFGEDQLLGFEFTDLLFVGGDHRRIAGIDNPLQQLVGLPAKIGQGAFYMCLHRLCLNRTLIPRILEHRAHSSEQRGTWLQLPNDFRELAFQPVAGDGFAATDAPAIEAEVVGILLARAAFRPACRHRLPAVGAHDEATQREIVGDLLSGRGYGNPACQSLLNLLVLLQRDQRLMNALAAGNTPLGRFYHPGIDRALEHVRDLLEADRAVRQVFRESRLRFEEAFHFPLCFEAATGEAFECFLHNGGDRFVTDQQLATSLEDLMPIADELCKRPLAVHHTGPHPVDGLLPVFAALMLRHAGEHVFDQP